MSKAALFIMGSAALLGMAARSSVKTTAASPPVVAQPVPLSPVYSFDALPVGYDNQESEPEIGSNIVIDVAENYWSTIAGIFKPELPAESSTLDFRGWGDVMSPELVNKLNTFVDRVKAAGGRVFISPASGALGRHDGLTGTSQHNVDRWGEVRAADVMVEKIGLKQAVQIARSIGFTGIGAYPDWRPSQGLHLDIRADRSASNPAEWSGKKINGVQNTGLAISQAWS